MIGTTRDPACASRPALLCVDDEPHVLEGLRDILRRSFDVRVATSGQDGLAILNRERDTLTVVISDMRMPVMGGVEFLRAARLIAPDTVAVLLTGAADLDAAIRAVNEARLFRFLTKPCEGAELLRACAAALSQHRLQTTERALVQQTLHGSVDALAEVLAVAKPAAFGRAARLRELAGSLARSAGMANRWEVEVAAMLAHIGAVTLPQATAEKLYAGLPLTRHEAEMAARVPLVTRRLLSKIPRLERVLHILERYPEPPDAGSGAQAPREAQVLRIAVDYAELEAKGVNQIVALGTMRGRGVYSPELIDALAAVVGVGCTADVQEIALSDLTVGMMLADDVRSLRGNLLVARGQRVGHELIERLRNQRSGSVLEPILVYGHAGNG